MERESLSFAHCIIVAAAVLGLFLPATVSAAEQGWSTTVETKSEAMARQMRALPSAPPPARKKPAAAAVAVPPVKKPAPVIVSNRDHLVPVDESDITTGTVGSPTAARTLPPDDQARIFADDAIASPDDVTTGTVDGQGSDLSRGYCVSIAPSAADARSAQQMAKLSDIEKRIGQRIATLEAKTAEYKSWVERRDDFLKRASASLVKIYTQMEPDSAALQLVSMDEETAASLLLKLDPQAASAILNEMVPEKAGRLAATISGAARPPRPAPPPAPPAARPPADLPERVYPDGGRS